MCKNVSSIHFEREDVRKMPSIFRFHLAYIKASNIISRNAFRISLSLKPSPNERSWEDSFHGRGQKRSLVRLAFDVLRMQKSIIPRHLPTLTELSVNLVDHNDPGIEEKLSKWISTPNKIQSLKITAFLTRKFTKTLMESIRNCY